MINLATHPTRNGSKIDGEFLCEADDLPERLERHFSGRDSDPRR